MLINKSTEKVYSKKIAKIFEIVKYHFFYACFFKIALNFEKSVFIDIAS